MLNLHDLLERLRAAQQKLTAQEAGVLFSASVRLAAAQGATVRARLVELDDQGALHLKPFDDRAPEEEPGYLAPELLQADAPRKAEPRVQVYAAGALGYELLTGRVPDPERAPGAELGGALGDLVRLALAADRRERFGDLTQLCDAVDGVQPRLSDEAQRQMLLGLRARALRLGGNAAGKEALAKLIEKVGALELAQKSVAAQHRALSERLDRVEGEQQRAAEAMRRRGSNAPVAVIAGALAAAGVLGAAWAAGLLQPGQPVAAQQPVAQQPVAQQPPGAAPPEAKPPETARSEAKPAEAKQAAAPVETPDATVADDAPDAATLAAAAPDAAVIAAAAPDAGAPEQPPRVAPRPPPRKVNLTHAVALSQIKLGESALEKNRVDDAIGSFNAALENEPNLATAFRGLGMAYATRGEDRLAQQNYERYLQLAPQAPDSSEIQRSIAELKARSKAAGEEK